jgi:hypothetical protein
MKDKKYALSIVEAMIIILIIVTWVVWVYGIYTKSTKATNNIENRIQAIQIAREWIEAMMNIRDTNWVLFSSDKKNCWKTLNYDIRCIWDNENPKKSQYITDHWSYKVFRNESWSWILDYTGAIEPNNYENPSYRDFFKVSLDKEWFYTQSWGITTTPQNFTRELVVGSISAGSLDADPINFNAIEVKSIVKWVDSSSVSPQDVVLEMTLTNYNK